MIRTAPRLILVLAALAACNDIPEGTVVEVTPGAPTTVDDLTAAIITEATDKHPVTYSYQWSVDGEVVASRTTETVPASATARGEVWTVTVTPNDGKVDGPAAEASVEILNTAPEAEVGLTPSTPSTLEDLVATIQTSDVDDDEVEVEIAWTRDGAAIDLDGTTVPAARTTKGEVWEITVTPSDQEYTGSPVTAAVTIGNTPPTALSVDLTPSAPRAGDTLTALPAGEDIDEDPLTWTCTWYVNGVAVPDQATASLAGAFVKADVVRVEAVASDGEATSDAVLSAGITVANTPPSVASATIDPATPRGDSTLTCVPGGAADVDGDEVSFTTVWTVNGREVGTADRLEPGSFAKGDRVRCSLTPFDGDDEGTAIASGVVEIANTPPSLTSASISPSPARTGDSLTAVPSGASDLDGDPVSYTYAWSVDGTSAGTGSTLGSGSHSKGDVVEVEVTPTDGEDAGTSVTASITIANTAPTAPAVAIDPGEPGDDDDLLCDITTLSTDVDDDRLTYTISWTRNGASWRGSTSTTTYSGDTIAARDTTKNEEWQCSAVASDGTDTSPRGTSSTVEIDAPDGRVRTTGGRWVDAWYEPCGSGTTCNATQAKAACTGIGKKVASHASNGTSDVFDLGASSSCYWSVSYYEVDSTMPSGSCLVGISNLEWSNCCGTSMWHGNTMSFGSAGSIFGYVRSGDSGYVSSYSNRSGTTWGCQSESTSAWSSGCTTLYVACVN